MVLELCSCLWLLSFHLNFQSISIAMVGCVGIMCPGNDQTLTFYVQEIHCCITRDPIYHPSQNCFDLRERLKDVRKIFTHERWSNLCHLSMRPVCYPLYCSPPSSKTSSWLWIRVASSCCWRPDCCVVSIAKCSVCAKSGSLESLLVLASLLQAQRLD